MRVVLLLLVLAVGCAKPVAVAPVARPEVAVRAQRGDEAFEYLWTQLGDMPFFRKHHYEVALPSHALFKGYAKDGLEDADRGVARQVFLAEVYDERAFDAGIEVLRGRAAELAHELDAFQRWAARWGFAAPRRYDVALTLYGPGGSYDPEAARVTVLTTADGRFKKEPIHNLVHEMVHIGIERPIVQRFGLSHPEKERLVDRICVVAFGDRLANYQVQPMGPPELDPYVTASSVEDLPRSIERYRAAR